MYVGKRPMMAGPPHWHQAELVYRNDRWGTSCVIMVKGDAAITSISSAAADRLTEHLLATAFGCPKPLIKLARELIELEGWNDVAPSFTWFNSYSFPSIDVFFSGYPRGSSKKSYHWASLMGSVSLVTGGLWFLGTVFSPSYCAVARGELV